MTMDEGFNYDTDWRGDVAEVVIRSDSQTVWVHVDGHTRLRAHVKTIRVEDQRQTTFEETIGYLATELSQLRSTMSQRAERQREKSLDAREGRRYADSHIAQGRREAFEMVAAIADRIIKDYDLDGRD
jgi:hypothetical protein